MVVGRNNGVVGLTGSVKKMLKMVNDQGNGWWSKHITLSLLHISKLIQNS